MYGPRFCKDRDFVTNTCTAESGGLCSCAVRQLNARQGPPRLQAKWRTKLGGTMGESAYSYSLTTFSPSGKLVQIEYALSAVTKAP